MKKKKTGRYSYLIRPSIILVDLLIINFLANYWFSFLDDSGVGYYYILLSISWIAVSWGSGFYDVYRHTRVVRVLEKIFKQFVLQFILVSALNGFIERFAEPKELIAFGFSSLLVVSSFKFLVLFVLKYIRRVLGGNFRNIVLVGSGKEIDSLKKVLLKREDLGYRISKVFDNVEDENLDEVKKFILSNEIDELYIQFSIVQNDDYHKLLEFADNNFITVKYVPSQKQLLNHNFTLEYYDVVAVVPRRIIPLDKSYNKFVKRVFDLVFSTLVIVFILSWLVPLIAILIKSESKGPVFFKQMRTGLNDEEFACWKFRSMQVNEDSDKKQATKDDCRITKVGAFLRKSSLDEFPQFLNVFVGNMSIVGPRPHMIVHTKMYSKRVNRFMLRHLVKPGITGMAQTHGYRGEIETNRDIINRFKYDLFYLENWSVFLDLKIIYLTVYNVFKGEKKAY